MAYKIISRSNPDEELLAAEPIPKTLGPKVPPRSWSGARKTLDWKRLAKRIFDLTAGLLVLPVILPPMLVLGLMVKLDSPGPALFNQLRVGKKGQRFYCRKFRTMAANSQELLENLLATDSRVRAEWEREFKLRQDPRVTRLGRFLRRTSLDELPQIFNVIAGEMSLVGPRPIIEAEIARYGPHFDDYQRVLPGITGLWQVSGRNDLSYPERVLLDSWYIRNWSFRLDLIILMRTAGAVISGKGAY